MFINILNMRDKIKNIEIENEFINSLLFENNMINIDDKIKELKQLKRYNEIYLFFKSVSEFELNKKRVIYLIDKIENLLY